MSKVDRKFFNFLADLRQDMKKHKYDQVFLKLCTALEKENIPEQLPPLVIKVLPDEFVQKMRRLENRMEEIRRDAA